MSDIERTDTVDEIVGTAKLRVLANLPYGERKRVDDERSVLNILDAINLRAILAAAELSLDIVRGGQPLDSSGRYKRAIEAWDAATAKLREGTG